MDITTRFKDWLVLAQHSDFEMERFHRPSYVAGVATPSNLFGLSLRQLISLSEVGDTDDSFYSICETVLGLKRDDVDEARAVDVVRFVGWVSGELDKVNRMFEKVEASKPTDMEKRAGIETLRFGLFGMIDWFAKRMGIEDHDKVLNYPWLRIYKCMDIDNKTNLYNARLQKLQAQEMRRKK